MELLRKAENLAEAYQLLDPDRPLEGEWLEHFYAKRPEEASITPLIDGLVLDSREDDKTLFTGHRGNGKTTELARLEQMLESTHTVVRFNVESLLNPGDVDYADLLVVLGLQVFHKAKRSGIEAVGGSSITRWPVTCCTTSAFWSTTGVTHGGLCIRSSVPC